MQGRFEIDAQLVRPSWRWTAAPFALLAGGTGLILAHVTVGVLIQFVATMILGIGIARKPRRSTPVRLRVDATGVWAGDERLATMDAIDGIAAVPIEPSGRLVTLSLRGRRAIELVVLRVRLVEELKTALGLAMARPAAASFRVHVALGAIALLLALPLATLLGTLAIGALPQAYMMLGAGILLPLVFVAVPLAIARVKAATITIGDEGIHVDRWYGKRLVRYAELKALRSVAANIVRIVPHRGWTIPIELPSAQDARVFVDHVEEHRAQKTPDDAREDALGAILERGSRSTEEWLAEVRLKAAPSGEAYRRGAMPEERLFAVLEDPSSPPHVRIAAGVALRAGGGQPAEVVRRVRVAAASTAFPELRDALEMVADEPDEAALPARLVRVLR